MLDRNDFIFLRELVRSKSGISLSDEKEYLIESRLTPVARKHGLGNIGELVNKIKTTVDENIAKEIIDAMTTNETLFFRDVKPFNILKEKVLPHVLSSGGGLRIWCAACSSGQEPYSLAMTMLEKKQRIGERKIEIIGTDISNSILAKAREGIYSQFEVQRGLPITMLMKYFTQGEKGSDKWLLKDEVKKMVEFKYHNLLESFASLGKFDVIFCRNVLIYFGDDVKKEILNKIATCLKPGGVLFLGSADNISALTNKFRPFDDEKGIYKLA